MSDEDGDVIIISGSFFVRETLYSSSGRVTECCEMCVSAFEQDSMSETENTTHVHACSL